MPAVNINSQGTTETPPHSLGNTVAAIVAPSPKVLAQSHDHSEAPERYFIGPMPSTTAKRNVEETASDGGKKPWWLTLRVRGQDDQANDGDEDEDEDEVPEGHAFRYFLQRGGKEEEWGAHESLRKGTKREILRQWRQSGWASISRRGKKGELQPKKWIGETFKIGNDFLGVPMQTDAGIITHSADLTPQLESSTPQKIPALTSRMLSSESYHTALQGPSEPVSGESSIHSSSSDRNNRDSRSNGSGVALLPSSEPLAPRRTVSLPLLMSPLSAKAPTNGDITAPKALPRNGDTSRTITSEVVMTSANKPMPLRSAIRRLREDGGSKTVQFSSVPQPQVRPAPPSEVLARQPSDDPDTSAGAVATHSQDQGSEFRGENFTFGDVERKDRMLIRRSHVKSGDVGAYFDAEEAMKIRDLRSYEWKEFLVVWRKDRLELYEDYSIPGKELILGHKHLACVIPLQKPETHLSLYSFVDLTFCLTCTMLHVPKDKIRTASSLSARIHFHRSTGTDIFVFKAKTRTSGIDWMWEIWRRLGNEIPNTFEVHCPALETRVRLHVPEFDSAGGEGYKIFSRDKLLELCRKALKDVPSWDYLIEEPIRHGSRLELCWRKESMLDWVRWETDVDERKRPWAVLYGLCLRKPREITHLEARIGEHRPTTIALSDGTHLREPPAVEGYLYRIKPTSQSRVQVYLSTHAGCLFSINPNRAQPPRPPIPMTNDAQAAEENGDSPLTPKDREIQRGTQQVLQANGFIDLRSIVAIRRAFQLSVPPRHLDPNGQNNPRASDNPDQIQEDNADEGGDDVLARHPDKPALKMRRSFELLMRTDYVVRFEAYSCKVAQEWVANLSKLVEYWTHRHRVDASQEMELIHAITGKPGLVITKPDEEAMPERPPDYDQSSEYLPSFWNWCVLDRCLSVVRNGRLFLRRGLRGQYKLMQLVLVSGHLIQFHITTQGASHHMRSKTASLLDAYVCSGHFATQSLPVDEFSTDREPLPRRFQDGLETEDPELDTVFLIWYRPHAIDKMNGEASPATIPPLKAKHNVLVLKARSRLERDAWCWALNAEIERTSRRSGDREARARDGGLAKL